MKQAKQFSFDGMFAAETVREIVDCLKENDDERSFASFCFEHVGVALELICNYDPETFMINFRVALPAHLPPSTTKLVNAVISSLPTEFRPPMITLPDDRIAFENEMRLFTFQNLPDVLLVDRLVGWKADYLGGVALIAKALAWRK